MNTARPAAVVALSLLLAACSGSSGRAPVVPPTGLSVSAQATSLRLTWVDESAFETGFAIDRADKGGEFVRIAQVAANVTIFADKGLLPQTTYRYRVHAMTATGGEIVSAEVTVSTVTPTFTSITPATAFERGGQRVTFRGDGFSAGVSAVTFAGVSATELDVVDDATLVCTTPASVRPGLAPVTVTTPTAEIMRSDAFSYFSWPPVYTAPEDILADAEEWPADVQMVADDSAATLVWSQSKPERAIFAARGIAGKPWGSPTRLDGGMGLPWHPHAAIDGTNVYVVWVDLGYLHLAKSDDGGDTWLSSTRVAAPVGSVFHPRVSAHGQRVHVAWSDERARRGELYHNYSSNGGLTFQNQATRVSIGLGAYDLQIATVGQHVYLLWWSGSGIGGIYFNRSTDGGATWPELDQLLRFLPGTVRASPPQLAVNNGRIYAVSQEGGDKRIAIVRSTDGGVTWGAKQLLDRDDDASRSPQVAVTPNGSEVYVAWDEGGHLSKIAGVDMNRSLDGGETYLPWPARVAAYFGSLGTTPVLCCNGKVVTVAFASNAPGGAHILVNSSSDWGLRWQREDLRLSENPAFLPNIHCHGAEMVISWSGIHLTSNRYYLRAVRTKEQ